MAEMAGSEADRIQECQSRIGGLRVALDACLSALATQYGVDAHVKIVALRDELIKRLKESDISPQRELEHAKICQTRHRSNSNNFRRRIAATFQLRGVGPKRAAIASCAKSVAAFISIPHLLIAHEELISLDRMVQITFEVTRTF